MSEILSRTIQNQPDNEAMIRGITDARVQRLCARNIQTVLQHLSDVALQYAVEPPTNETDLLALEETIKSALQKVNAYDIPEVSADDRYEQQWDQIYHQQVDDIVTGDAL